MELDNNAHSVVLLHDYLELVMKYQHKAFETHTLNNEVKSMM